jgi:hypothetical protein
MACRMARLDCFPAAGPEAVLPTVPALEPFITAQAGGGSSIGVGFGRFWCMKVLSGAHQRLIQRGPWIVLTYYQLARLRAEEHVSWVAINSSHR